jgi:hypothetical protein
MASRRKVSAGALSIARELKIGRGGGSATPAGSLRTGHQRKPHGFCDHRHRAEHVANGES